MFPTPKVCTIGIQKRIDASFLISPAKSAQV
jgi:hypothetical protein